MNAQVSDITVAEVDLLNEEMDQIELLALYLDPSDPIESLIIERNLSRLNDIYNKLERVWLTRVENRRSLMHLVSQ